jgi:hypothetical protein
MIRTNGSVRLDRMSCIQGLLGSLSYGIESQLKPALSGLTGFLVRGYLPQAWVFETESEIATLTVDAYGNVSTQPGGLPSRDVTIRWTHDLLASVLKTRSRASVPSDAHPSVTTHTPKGQTAFSYLRGRFGL